MHPPEENAHDKSSEPVDNDRIVASNDDLHQTNADRFTGSDRTGTTERKDNGRQ